MRRWLLATPLLLAACASRWPEQPYVRMTKGTDVAPITAAMVNCFVEIVPPGSILSAAPDILSNDLAAALAPRGLTLRPGGLPVSYLVSPLSPGEFIRTAAPDANCSQYLSRDPSGKMRPDGPLMVLQK